MSISRPTAAAASGFAVGNVADIAKYVVVDAAAATDGDLGADLVTRGHVWHDHLKTVVR